MSTLLDSLKRGLDHLPEPLRSDASRRAALDAALRDGLPDRRSERWKYTPLRALERRSFVPIDVASSDAGSSNTGSIDPGSSHAEAIGLLADVMPVDGIPVGGMPIGLGPNEAALANLALDAAVAARVVSQATPLDPAPLAGTEGVRLVFVNGRFDAARSQLQALPDGVLLAARSSLVAKHEDIAQVPLGSGAEQVFARLNLALSGDGVSLHIAAGTRVPVPIHLVFVGRAAGADLAWHLRHRVVLGDDATATIVEHQLSAGAHAHLDNSVLQLQLASGAQLLHARIQDQAAGATLIQRTHATLAARAGYRRVDLELGAALSRHELDVDLAGEHATLHAGGILLGDARRHLDTRLGIVHVARDTACHLLWRALADERAHAVFHGGITIQAGAAGSDARLSNKNLLLSASAEIDAQPVLEIHADEVKAAHGATVGQLDDTALFYLRSRGIPAAQARQLLTAAFCREPLRALDDGSAEAAALIERLSLRVDARLATLGAAVMPGGTR